MKKILSVLLAVAMLVSMSVTAFAAEKSNPMPSQSVTLFDLADNINIMPQNGTLSTNPDTTVTTGEITDVNTIQALVYAGIVECGENGALPTKVVVTQVVDNSVVSPVADVAPANAPITPISISKYDYYDGQYFDEYDRYQVDGPSQFSTTYSRTSTANWNTSMTTGVEVSGKVYSVAEVKGAISSSTGYTIGSSYTKSSSYTVNIPENKYWIIKVWTSYRVFSYTAKVGTVEIASGKSWYPNGLVILHTEYNS